MTFPAEVVKIQTSHGQESGVLISPDEVLTAAHGLEVNGAQYSPVASIIVTTTQGYDFNANATGPSSGVVSYHINPVQTDPYSAIGNDFALLKLTAPLGFETGYARLESDYQGTVTAFGYGGGWSGPQFTPFAPIPGGSDSVYETNGWQASGNSGGPLFHGVDLISMTDQVVGIISGTVAGTYPGQPLAGVATVMTAANIVQIEGWMAQDGESPVVERLYQGVLDRTPDYAGLVSWSHVVANQNETVAQIAGDFIHSPEFLQGHGAITTEGLIDLLYHNALGRAPETGAVAAWEHSGLSPEMIVVGVTQSAEAMAHQPIY